MKKKRKEKKSKEKEIEIKQSHINVYTLEIQNLSKPEFEPDLP